MFRRKRIEIDDNAPAPTCPVCSCTNHRIGSVDGAPKAMIFECGLTVNVADATRISHCDTPARLDRIRMEAKTAADDRHAAAEVRVKLDYAHSQIVDLKEQARDNTAKIAAMELERTLSQKDASINDTRARGEIAELKVEVHECRALLGEAEAEIAELTRVVAEARAENKAAKGKSKSGGDGDDNKLIEALKKISQCALGKDTIDGKAFADCKYALVKYIKEVLGS